MICRAGGLETPVPPYLLYSSKRTQIRTTQALHGVEFQLFCQPCTMK